MPSLTIQLDRQDASYVPGEPITGRVSWDLAQGPERIVVRLLWQTSGKGTQDVGVAHEQTYEHVSMRESRDFSFAGLEGPYSFSGKLITVAWQIEAFAEPGDEADQQLITVSPTGAEVRP